MKLEYQVVNLELSKRLKELGVENESLFYWTDNQIIFQEYCSHYENCISAFTASELLEILPKSIWHNGNPRYLTVEPANRLGHWLVFYHNDAWSEEQTVCDALAKMLISLIENKIIEV